MIINKIILSKKLYCFKFFFEKHYFPVALIAVLIAISNIAQSQEFSINASLDTNQIVIGQQTGLKISVLQDKSANVKFPEFKDTIVAGVEIIAKSNIDTVKATGQNFKVEQRLTVTSFDKNEYYIPPLKFQLNKNGQVLDVESNSLFLEVLTVKLDTTNAIFDIHMPIDTPFTFKEFWDRFGVYTLIGLLVTAIIIFLIYYLKKKKKNQPLIIRPKIIEPAHVIAMRELDTLKAKKLWQQERFKEYHSELTDVLRVYLFNRYQVHTLEKTTDEIMISVQGLPNIQPEQISQLRKILKLADMVKFAKELPLPAENENSWTLALDFVLATKYVPPVRTEENEQEVEPKEVTENITKN